MSHKSIPKKLLIPALIVMAPVCFAAWTLISTFFEPPQIYRTGLNPLDVVAGDVNGDGHLDVLTANRDGRSVSVFLGDGRGTLAGVNDIATGLGATSLALADMDGDGKTDVVVSLCNQGCSENRIAIYSGKGNGHFEESRILDVDGVPYNLVVADIDDDGRMDIAASDYPNDRLIVLLTRGSSERFETNYLYTGSKPIALALADLNGDGTFDLVSSDHGSGGSSVYLSYADGTFSDRIRVATGELPYAITLGSVDGDSLPDLVVAHSTAPGRLSVLQGRGDGTFSPRDDFEVKDRLLYVQLADLDHDGRKDIVVTRDKERYASAWLNEGDGFFDRSEIIVPAENQIYSLDVADLNEDRLPDLIAVDYGQATLSISLGQKPSREAVR